MICGLLSFALMLAYWPGISSPASTPRWILLACAVPALLLFQYRMRITIAHVAGGALVLWSALTLAWDYSLLDGIGALWRLVIVAAVFCLGSTLPNLRPVYVGAAYGIAINGAIAIAQLCGWQGVQEVASPSGLFTNRNFLGEAAALTAVGLLGAREWALPLLALVLAMSRGALIGFAIPCWIALRRWRKKTATVFLAAAIVVGMIWTLQSDYKAESSIERLTLWRFVAVNITWTGYGLGSFWERSYNGQQLLAGRHEHPHNEVLEIAFEQGICGLALYLAFVVPLFCVPLPLSAERLGVVAFLAIGMFGFPSQQPATAFLGALCAGRGARDLRSVRELVGDGRDAVSRWVRGERIETRNGSVV